MPDSIAQFSEEVRQNYWEPIAGAASRLERGGVLWSQFETAISACSANGEYRQLAEKVNELAVAKILLDDAHLTHAVQYEPNFLPSGRKIDFVAVRANDQIYVEVKTVHPKLVDSEAAWKHFLKRQEYHPPNVNFITQQENMGGALYGSLVASRSKFLDYTLDFESRLREAKEIRGGPGVLVFCDNGIAWNLTDLEDFADFYNAGSHRQDDLFSLMELHHMKKNGIKLLQNIDHFSYLKRANKQPLPREFKFSVHGPRMFAPTGNRWEGR